MKRINVIIDSYNLVFQNKSGGIKVRIQNFEKRIASKVNIKKYDKWNDSIEDYDVIHIFKSSAESYSLLKYAHSKNIPVVVSSVVPSEKRIVILLNRIICKFFHLYTERYMNELVLRNADAICAQTYQEKRFISKAFHINDSCIRVIPNGISLKNNPSIDSHSFSEMTGISGDFVLMVGRFDENKNQLNVIKAIQNTDINLVLIGGADKENLDYFEKCKNVAGSNVHFLGWVEHDNPILEAAYKAAKTVILASHKEIFGNSLIEGGACGANLVVSNALPIDEWGIKDYCITINPNNIKEIQEAIFESMRTEKNETVKNTINELFSWDSVIDQYIDVYNEVIERRTKND